MLVIYSCEKENEIIENHNEFIIKELNFKDLISNPNFQEGYQKLNYKKSSKNDIYNFTIDSSKIKKVEMNDYTPFTLLIQRPFETPECFEILVIEESGGAIKAYLIKYNLLSNIKSFDEHHTFSFNAATSVIPLSLDIISKSTGECSPVAQTWCNWGGEPHVAGHACFMADDGRTYLVYVVDENCSETGPGLGNNGGGAFSGNETDEPIITSPVNPDGNPVDFPDATTANEINHILGNLLSESQMFWLFDNARQAEEIKLFLETHNSVEAEAFAEEVIKMWSENPEAEVDFAYQVIVDRSFKENQSLMDVYEAMGKAPTFDAYLKNFDSEMSVANLKFGADPNFASNRDPKYHNAMAITNPPLISNLINIDFNTDASTSGNILDKPDVFKAVSLIHEVLHAEMYRKMLDAVRLAEINNNSLNWTSWTSEEFYNDFLNSLENKYFGIFHYFTKYNYGVPEGSNPNDYQHQLMAESYRNVVKQALTEYDPSLTETQKEALSWIGLNSADIVAWQLKTPEEQEAIKDLIEFIQNNW